MGTSNTLFVVDSEMVTAVNRLPKSHKAFNEAWVRDLMFNNPAVLPVEEVLSDAGTFVPIGIEISLDRAGKADVLGVTTGGYPVVIETKLWRNPQARREVLAQTIDYVKEIAKLDYEWFNKLWVARCNSAAPKSLFEAAAAVSDTELDEAEFIDRIDRACRNGDILGFIVGDGIQYGLAELIAHLGRESSHLRYSLPLLELKCFELSDGKLAVLPTIVREVIPVERAYIRIEPTAEFVGQIKVVSVAKPKPPNGGKTERTTLTEEEFWEGFIKAVGDPVSRQVRDFVENLRQSTKFDRLEYKQRALMLKVAHPDEAAAPASVFAITSDGLAYNTSHGIRQAKKWGITDKRVMEILNRYWQRLHTLCPGFRIDGIVHLSTTQFVPISEFVGKLDQVAQEIYTVATELRNECGED